MKSQQSLKDGLLHSETAVLEAVAASASSVTQRELAQRTGYSIGLINAILKKLAKTGYIKIANLNKRRLQYLLTPTGLAATSRQSYLYVLKTFRDYHSLSSQIANFFSKLYKEGHRDVCIQCDAELRHLINMVIKGQEEVKIQENPGPGIAVVQLQSVRLTSEGPMLEISIANDSKGAVV